MRVAFIARPDLQTNPGGDTVQVKETACALAALGVDVDLAGDGSSINYESYDLLHLFNIIDCEDLLVHAMKARIPYVLSTIYVDYREYDRTHRKDLIGNISRVFGYDTVEYIKTVAKVILRGERVSTPLFFLKGHRGSVKYLLKHAACILPNSYSELNRITRDYCYDGKAIIVPNGVSSSLADEKLQGERVLVLCAARIEGRKNQLNLIRAMKDMPQQLVLTGAPSLNQQGYVELCKSKAGERTDFRGFVSQREQFDLYKKARVHVLPSWFETTGLSSLEAAVMGCNIVVADRGDVREYFGDLAWYCDPASHESIRNAILEAWNAPFRHELRDRILENFTWEKAAKRTLEAYQLVLQQIT
jgi:glycosyltransferase involved in cell wall biosynthesis